MRWSFRRGRKSSSSNDERRRCLFGGMDFRRWAPCFVRHMARQLWVNDDVALGGSFSLVASTRLGTLIVVSAEGGTDSLAEKRGTLTSGSMPPAA